MSTSKTKQLVRPEQKVRKINSLPQAENGKSSRAAGLIPLYATSALPVATNLPNGTPAYDLTVSGLKIVVNGAWVLANS